jgi:hypothetical protein
MSKRTGKVSEAFNIDEDLLSDKASSNDYWEQVEEFYGQVKDKNVAVLSAAQLNWLQKIETSLSEL